MTAKKRPEEIEANRARANQKRRLRHLWKGELTIAEICDEMEMGRDEMLAFAESLGLDVEGRPEVECFIPTPEQIRLAAAEIRRGWTSAELDNRRVSPFGRLK